MKKMGNFLVLQFVESNLVKDKSPYLVLFKSNNPGITAKVLLCNTTQPSQSSYYVQPNHFLELFDYNPIFFPCFHRIIHNPGK
jgi:hypothetical protein